MVSKSEFSHRRLISGKTMINHRIRVALKMSVEEYVICDFVFSHNKTKTTSITFGDYYRETGFIAQDIKSFMQQMKTNGLLVWNEREKRVDVNSDWKAHHSTSGLLDILWAIHNKGNKATAKERLPKALKKIEFEELKKKLIAYIKHCDENGTFKKGLDVWLNPVKEHWEDILANNSKLQPPVKVITSVKFKK